MALTTRDFPRLYFRKVIRDDIGRVSMDADMMRLLMVVDENKNVTQIAKESGMKLANLETALSNLIKAGLLERVERVVEYLNDNFLLELKENLTIAIGPMADLIIEDILDEMDLPESEVPKYLGAELIHNLASQIPRKEKRLQFQEVMMAKLG